jgi:predicted nucleic acid-binding protein
MAPTRGSAVFLDTNILIYASFRGTTFHEAARLRLDELERDGIKFWTSRQVLREYLASATRPGAILPSPAPDGLAEAIRRFEAEFEIVDDDEAVTALLLDLFTSRNVKGKQIHDANIVATMLRNKISWLLTHNTADFTRYATEINVLPLMP